MNRPSDWHKAQPPMRHQKGWPKIVNAGCQDAAAKFEQTVFATKKAMCVPQAYVR